MTVGEGVRSWCGPARAGVPATVCAWLASPRSVRAHPPYGLSCGVEPVSSRTMRPTMNVHPTSSAVGDIELFRWEHSSTNECRLTSLSLRKPWLLFGQI